MLFKDLENINSNIAAELSKHNINEMTDVQAKTYKHIYNNKDLIVCSGTGTGKTLAYLCPIISRLSDTTKNIQAIILVPNGELASQINKQLEDIFSYDNCPYSSMFVTGEGNINRQLEALKHKPAILVGTPARVYQLINIKKLKVHEVKTIVLDEADKFDEEHLLPIALETFGSAAFPVQTEYVGIKKSSRSKTATVARRLYFENYYSFILTDFFEGLHHGHYPRQCEICKKYFLMTSARKQKYCNGIAPYEYNGEKMTCRQYAVIMGKKEKVDAHPILSIHKKRCNCIRAELSKGTITKEFATAAKEIADELKTLAVHGDGYTAEQFKRDMTREALYALTDKRLKQQK